MEINHRFSVNGLKNIMLAPVEDGLKNHHLVSSVKSSERGKLTFSEESFIYDQLPSAEESFDNGHLPFSVKSMIYYYLALS